MENPKYQQLIDYLQGLGKVVLAFSGGVDSTFLLQAGKEALGDNMKAITILSPYIPKWEVEEAKELVKKIGAHHEIIEVPIIDAIKENPEDRCYRCKKAIFTMIQEKAMEEGFDYVIDGTNFDDLGDYRPGLKALGELKIKSPLLECKITKNEIRQFSKELGLVTWDKPAYACLLTRIPYGNALRVEDFVKIEEAEKYMMSIGFRAVRVRCHDDLARIEVNREDRQRLFDVELMDKISDNLRRIGFKHVTLDLQGYRMGSFNETIDTSTE